MQNTIYFSIADFRIKLQSDSPILLEEGYLPFQIDGDDNLLSDLTVTSQIGLPTQKFEANKLVFEAENNQQKFYSIYRSGTDLAFVIYNQQEINTIQQIAFLNENLSEWTVFAEPSSDCVTYPLRYPLGPIIMHYLTVKYNAVMIHASCIFDGAKGRLFTGFSGNGKSTISKIWADAGNLIINDDRIIIRKDTSGYVAYNTPMYYNDRQKKTNLNAIYLISHSPENKIKQISGALAVSKVLAFCIQNNFDQRQINGHLDFLSELSLQVPVYELGFVPDESVVNFILANETGAIK